MLAVPQPRAVPVRKKKDNTMVILALIVVAVLLFVLFNPAESEDDDASDVFAGANTNTDISKMQFPYNWGTPPKDAYGPPETELSGQYGMGTYKLQEWIMQNIELDAQEAEAKTQEQEAAAGTGYEQLLAQMKVDSGCAKLTPSVFQLTDCTSATVSAKIGGGKWLKTIRVKYKGTILTEGASRNDATVVKVNGFPVMRLLNVYSYEWESGTAAVNFNVEYRVLKTAALEPTIEITSASKNSDQRLHMEVLEVQVLVADSEEAAENYQNLDSSFEGLGVGSQQQVDINTDAKNTLLPGEKLHVHEFLTSTNGGPLKYRAVVEDTGSIEIMYGDNGSGDTTVTQTDKYSGSEYYHNAYYMMSQQGKLLGCSGDYQFWSNNRAAPAGSKLVLENDGVMVIEKDGIPYWYSDEKETRKMSVGQFVKQRDQKDCVHGVSGRWADARSKDKRCCPGKNWRTYRNLRGYCTDIPDGGDCTHDTQCESGNCHRKRSYDCPGPRCQPHWTCMRRF